MSFGIKDSNFMTLENYVINFLDGDWNYCLIKTDIDVMMLFKFDVKCVRLNFKAIASVEFSFDLKLYLLCSYDGSLFMKNCWKLLQKNSGKFKFHMFRSIENYFWSIEWNKNLLPNSIDFQFLVDRLNVLLRSTEQQSNTNQAKPKV